MQKTILNAIAVLGLFASPAHALANGLGGELTGGKADGQWGGELGLGYDIGMGPIIIRPIAGAFLSRDRSDCGNGAGDACHSTAASFYGKVEAAVAIPAFAQVGVGARYAREKVRPYALIALPIAPKLKVAGQVGDHYVSAGVRFGF